MPGLIGLTSAGSRPLDAASVVVRMQSLLTDPQRNVCEPVWADEAMCASVSHTGTGKGGVRIVTGGGRVAWLDGEVHNARAVAPRVPARELTDVRAVLEALGGDGSGLRVLDGAFAAAVYDAAEGTVRLVGDRFGLRPLYWTRRDGRLIWASNLGAFLGYPGYTPVIDERGVEEFFTVGHLIADRTLFVDVRLLPPATVLTYTIETGTLTLERYWDWDSIRPAGRIALNDAADELGRRFRHAVAVRAPADERVAVSLSGGLDSRAVLAAVPPRARPVPAITFGQYGALDIALAQQVAAVKGACHRIVPITAENWLIHRAEGVWWTDGQFNMIHLHGIEAAAVYREVCDAHLDGFGGDFILGGMYMGGRSTFDEFSLELAAQRMHCAPEFLGDLSAWEALGRTDYYLVENRARRMNNAGTRFMQTLVEERKPFLANEVVEFLFSLPDALRTRGRVYRRMLLRTFPEYYRGISWASLGVPISWPRGVRRAGRVLTRHDQGRDGCVRAVGLSGRYLPGYTDYPAWLRQAPAIGSVNALLRDPQALYPQYTSRDVALRLWEEHLAGADNARELGRRMTLEIWLQQVFAGRYRPVGDGDGI